MKVDEAQNKDQYFNTILSEDIASYVKTIDRAKKSFDDLILDERGPEYEFQILSNIIKELTDAKMILHRYLITDRINNYLHMPKMNDNIIGKKCYELWFDVTDELAHWSMSEYTVDDISFKGAIRLKEEEDPEYSWIYPNNGFYKVMSDESDGENEEYPTFFWDKDKAQKMLDHLNSIGYIGVGFR